MVFNFNDDSISLDGKEFPITKTDSGQLVVKISPEEWEALTPDQQQFIINADTLLARKWLGGATYHQGRPAPDQGPIWEV